MKCTECKFFRIIREPIIKNGTVLDWGRSCCEKHRLLFDYLNPEKLNVLRCEEVDDEQKMYKVLFQ